MGATWKVTLAEVRRVLKDPETGNQVIADDVIRQALSRSVILACGYMALGTAKVTDLITLVPGQHTYELSAGTPYDMIGELRLTSDNQEIFRKSREYVENLRQGDTVGTGRPQVHYLDPQQDGSTDVVMWPTPAAAETVTGWVNLEPQSWATDGEGVIPFSQRALRGVELLAAAAVADSSDDEVLSALGLPAKSSQGWRAEAMEMFRIEKLKVIQKKRAAGPRSPLWLYDWAGVWIGPGMGALR